MVRSESGILVTGAAGLLGFRLVSVLAESHRVIAVTHKTGLESGKDTDIENIRCDLADCQAVATLFSRTEPGVVVNCAAMTDVDGCEQEQLLAESLNSGIIGNLLTAIGDRRIRMVQISTDYIFDGSAGPYSEDSPANPLNVYGKTKLAGERAVRLWKGESLIVRTSALYDCRLRSGKANLFSAAYERLRSGRRVRAASDLHCNPIWTLNLSLALAEAIRNGLSGILHIAGPDYLSRQRFSHIIAEHFGYPTELIEGIPLEKLNRSAARPLRAGLEIGRASSMLKTRLLSPEQSFSHPDFDPE